jgi:hypothetical protein
MESSRDDERAERISESHLQFMRDYVARDEVICKAALERFLQQRLNASREQSETLHESPERF